MTITEQLLKDYEKLAEVARQAVTAHKNGRDMSGPIHRIELALMCPSDVNKVDSKPSTINHAQDERPKDFQEIIKREWSEACPCISGGECKFVKVDAQDASRTPLKCGGCGTYYQGEYGSHKCETQNAFTSVWHEGCEYMSHLGHVCNKCGKLVTESRGDKDGN